MKILPFLSSSHKAETFVTWHGNFSHYFRNIRKKNRTNAKDILNIESHLCSPLCALSPCFMSCLEVNIWFVVSTICRSFFVLSFFTRSLNFTCELSKRKIDDINIKQFHVCCCFMRVFPSSSLSRFFRFRRIEAINTMCLPFWGRHNVCIRYVSVCVRMNIWYVRVRWCARTQINKQ